MQEVSEFQPLPVRLDGLVPDHTDNNRGAAGDPAGAARGAPSPAASPGPIEDDYVEQRFLEAVADIKASVADALARGDIPPLDHDDEAWTDVVWGDATIVGQLDDAVLDGRHVEWGTASKAKTRPGDWKAKTGTLRDWLGQFGCRHRGRFGKDGPMFFGGSLIDGVRKKETVRSVHFLTLDFDGGAKFDDVLSEVREARLLGVIHTTYSHGAAKGEGGNFIEKFRVILPLSAPFCVSDVADKSEAANKLWGRYYDAVCARFGGDTADTACRDMSRAFYAAAHPHGTLRHRHVVLAGDLLDLSSITLSADENVFAKAGRAIGGGQGKSYATKNLMKFAAKFGDVFDADDWFDHTFSDVRGAASSVPGHHHACPNRGEHSEEDTGQDRGFVAINGTDNDSGFGAFCLHAHCKGLDRLDMLDLACVEAGVDDATALLSFCPEIEGRPHTLDDGAPKQLMVNDFADYAEFKTAFDALGGDATAQDHELLARRCGASGWSRGTMDDVWQVIGKRKRLLRGSFDQAVKEGRAQRVATQRQKSSGDQYAWLPGSYTVHDDWIHTQPDAEGTGCAVCKVFMPEALVRNGDNANWKLTIAYRTPDGVEKEFLVDFGRLSTEGNKVLGEMMSAGFQMRTGKAEKDAMQRLLGDLMTCPDIARSVLCDKPGWQAGGRYYVSPSGKVIGESPHGEVVTLHPDARFKNVSKGGTLEEEVAHLAEVVRGCLPDAIKAGRYSGPSNQGMPHLLIGLGAGLVGPAATLLPAEEGGGVILVGGSGLGKTTALELGASLWGHPKPEQSTLIEASATSNGLESFAVKATAAFLALNELKHVKKPHETLTPLLMGLAGGQGALRMKQDASGNRPTNTWRLFCAASSEKTLAELVRGDVVDGLYARFPEIMLGDAPKLDTSHPFRKVMLRQHEVYGHVAEAFIERLIKEGYNTEDGLVRLSTEVDAVWNDISERMQGAARALRKLAWIAWSLDRMVEWGFLPQDTPIDWAIRWAAQSAVEGGAGDVFSGSREIEQFMTNVARFAASNRIVTVQKPDLAQSGTGAHDVLGWMWSNPEAQDQRILVMPKDQILHVVPSGKTAADVASVMHKAGFLVARREAGPGGVKRDLVHRSHPMKGIMNFPHYRFLLPAEMLGSDEGA